MDRWNDELYHHGILGMRWGHRKQNTTAVKIRSSNKTVLANKKKYNSARANLGQAMSAVGLLGGTAIGAAAGGSKGALIGGTIGLGASIPFFSKPINDIRINMFDKSYKQAENIINTLKGRSVYEVSARKSAKRRMAVASSVLSSYGVNGYKKPR